MIPRAEKDQPTGDNPVAIPRHTVTYKTEKCMGIKVHLWCPGCQMLHTPTFRCPEHGGPPSGPVWQGDPHSDPFSMEPSLLVETEQFRCHSFIRNGWWQFLADSTHGQGGQMIELEPLPDWLVSNG